jgi:IS1 family transposase
MNCLTHDEKLSVISALVEGNSIRSTERMFNIHRDTIMRLMVATGQHCAKIMDAHIRNIKSKFIQCDELWTFVMKKQRRVRKDDPAEFGDQWVFVAIDADTKLIPSFTVGKRSVASTETFISDLSQRLAHRVQITTDGFRFYVNAIENSFGANVDFSQLVKLYGDYGQHDSAGKYSPGPIIETIVRIKQGTPDERHISTSYVERQNLTVRMGMRRLTRLTNGFSKKLENLQAACALHFAHYNFCRVHSSLRITPAMAAGISSEIWSPSMLLP